ncbi:hypothetical protein [Acidithiobacillus sp.]
MGWRWLNRMGSWLEGGAELVAVRPGRWLAFAGGGAALAAIPFPTWLMAALAPMGLLAGLRLAGRCAGESYTWEQTRHALAVAVLWGMVLAVFGMILLFGQDTVLMGALLSGIQMPWDNGIPHGFWGWWFGFGERFSDLAETPYYWFAPAFFGVALALHKGHGWLESELETTLALAFKPELRDPLIALWGGLMISGVLLPDISQAWLALLVWVFGPPVVYVAYQDVFADKQRPRRRQREAGTVPALLPQGQPQPVRVKG